MPASEEREFELKLAVTLDQLDRLRTSPILDELSMNGASQDTLRSIYFDTKDHAIRTRGMSLRVRNKRDRWTQTLKTARSMNAGVSQNVEIEHPVASDKPELDRLKETSVPRGCRKLLEADNVAPVFETVISRTTRMLRAPDGSEVEIALDDGIVTTGTKSAPIREVELELKSGHTSAVFDVAQSLCEGEAVRFSRYSKGELGYSVANGGKAFERKPSTYRPPVLKKSITARDAFVAYARACMAQISENWEAVLDGDDPEGAHQMRIGLRRLRALLKAYGKVADTNCTKRLASEAKRLGILVGELRDADVLADETVGVITDTLDSGIDLTALSVVLEAKREDNRDRVRRTLDSDLVPLFLLDLGRLLECEVTALHEESGPARDMARRALERSWHRARKLGKRIGALTVEERHRLRKDLKQLRYQAEFFGPLFRKGALKPYLKHLKRLQNILGYLNDVAAAERLRSMDFSDSRTPDVLQQASGFVIGWHIARALHAWCGAQSAWRALEKSDPFWRGG